MGKVIWTNHAIERNRERGVSESYINQTINHPDHSFPSGDNKTTYKKRFGHQTVTVIIKLTEKGDYLILSAWIDPPNFGTNDFKKNQRYHQMKKAGPIKKLWITLLNQIGY